MAETRVVLPEFPGFAVQYDLMANPFFEPIVVETLRKIKTVELGKTLLTGINAADPKFRGDFPVGINVIIKPLVAGMQYNQSGYKPTKTWGSGGAFKVVGMVASSLAGHNLKRQVGDKTVDCPFWKDGTSANMAVNTAFTGKDQGTVCYVTFSNAQFMTSKGEPCQPYIVLAHELIHSLHCLEGKHAGADEELLTSGEGKYADEPMSEAAFRRAFRLASRAAYY
jgi:hypothetical protein